MATQGNYSLLSALNRCLPVTRRVRTGMTTYNQDDGFGAVLDVMIKGFNAMLIQTDIDYALNGTAPPTYGSGTITLANAIAAGDTVTATFVNALIPALVTPGITVGPVVLTSTDTLTTAAAKLSLAINQNPTLMSYGFVATSASGVITVKAVGLIGNSTTMTTPVTSATMTATPTTVTGGTLAWPARLSAAFTLPTLAQMP